MTKEQVKAVLTAARALDEAIEGFGESGVPSGHLYAAVMGHMGIDTYTQLIGLLKKAGRVRESGNVLYAVR